MDRYENKLHIIWKTLYKYSTYVTGIVGLAALTSSRFAFVNRINAFGSRLTRLGSLAFFTLPYSK